MQYLFQLLQTLVRARRYANPDEHYLAGSIDAHDFEVRVQALERRRI